jgi:RHS repeat-associated protein
MPNLRLAYSKKGQKLQKNTGSYYPFGLKHKGYNANHFGRDHKYKYNNKELQDELGLNWYDYGARNYDTSIGRWINVDKLAEDPSQINLSPYAYVGNDPVSKNDPDGNCPSCLWGAVIGAAVDYGLQVATNYVKGKKGTDAWTDVSITSIAVSAGAGALSGGISSLK